MPNKQLQQCPRARTSTTTAQWQIQSQLDQPAKGMAYPAMFTALDFSHSLSRNMQIQPWQPAPKATRMELQVQDGRHLLGAQEGPEGPEAQEEQVQEELQVVHQEEHRLQARQEHQVAVLQELQVEVRLNHRMGWRACGRRTTT